MKVTLGRRGDYAVRAMLNVARHSPQRRKARQIVAEMDLPERYATQILGTLVNSGLLEAQAGPEGGYTLGRPAAEISLLEVVEVAEGPVTLDQCTLRGGPCDWIASCPVHASWAAAQEAFTHRLQRTSFAELAAADAALEAGEALTGDLPHQIPVVRRGVRPEAENE